MTKTVHKTLPRGGGVVGEGSGRVGVVGLWGKRVVGWGWLGLGVGVVGVKRVRGGRVGGGEV